MDVVLFYSEAAGDGVGLARLRRAVIGAGHKLVHVAERHHDPESLLDVPADLVVAAGGDGTVGAAARALAGSGVPLGVMPLGTANNVARSLGIHGGPDEVAATWRHRATASSGSRSRAPSGQRDEIPRGGRRRADRRRHRRAPVPAGRRCGAGAPENSGRAAHIPRRAGGPPALPLPRVGRRRRAFRARCSSSRS